ncbi:MAG: DUF3298 and DUF4163 domain-containing protein [Clostridiales bacterium]|nr:DUF3298 and DUF4163 domain-containing protein [Clostridiales bacterium]
MNKLDDLKKIYDSTEITDELEFKVRQSIRRTKLKNGMQLGKKFAIASVASLIIFTGMVNINQSFAMAMSELPVIGAVVKVLSYRFDVIENDNVNADIEAPVISGLEDEVLENALNEKYYEESKALYDDFIEEMGEIIEMDGHLGVDSGYVVMTDTDKILSIGRYVVNTVGSSSTTVQYDTIDKEEGILITLPGLFKDDAYIKRLSDYIIETMKSEMANDDSKVYWVGDDQFSSFESIDANQSFYITEEGKLVLSFDKYEIAPGYMGVITFEIPTEIISDLLVNSTDEGYVKP